LTNAIKKRSTAFLISDFMDNNFEDALKIASKKHDVVGLRIYDIRDTELPSIGLIKMLDAENGGNIWVDTSSNYIRDVYRHSWRKYNEDLNEMLSKLGVDYAQISTNEDYVKPLMNLFKRRAR
jgi:hypothetical protein